MVLNVLLLLKAPTICLHPYSFLEERVSKRMATKKYSTGFE
ncbi:hypothetical protein SZ39_2694 [Bacillus mycoides]|nr:hypothetical protein SZ39_2694 [Bacillus mycoides]